MAATPKFKVFDQDHVYQASCKEVEAAAALMAFYGAGATIRLEHSPKWTIWTEGIDGDAGESYDTVASVCHKREWQFNQDRAGRLGLIPGVRA